MQVDAGRQRHFCGKLGTKRPLLVLPSWQEALGRCVKAVSKILRTSLQKIWNMPCGTIFLKRSATIFSFRTIFILVLSKIISYFTFHGVGIPLKKIAATFSIRKLTKIGANSFFFFFWVQLDFGPFYVFTDAWLDQSIIRKKVLRESEFFNVLYLSKSTVLIDISEIDVLECILNFIK